MRNESQLKISESRRKLNNPYAHLDGDGVFSADFSGIHNNAFITNEIDSSIDLNFAKKTSGYSKNEIVKIVRDLHILLWEQRIRIGTNNFSPLDVLNPVQVLEKIGYKIYHSCGLGNIRVAGLEVEAAAELNTISRELTLSNNFSPDVYAFTAAHELAHVILHEGINLHRDKAINGSDLQFEDTRETEANFFAAQFLMPQKQVRKHFKFYFGTLNFSINESTASGFGVTSLNLENLRNRIRQKRDLSRLLASTERYNGVSFKSLSAQFGVSTEAMAIQLEDLNLIQY